MCTHIHEGDAKARRRQCEMCGTERPAAPKSLLAPIPAEVQHFIEFKTSDAHIMEQGFFRFWGRESGSSDNATDVRPCRRFSAAMSCFRK